MVLGYVAYVYTIGCMFALRRAGIWAIRPCPNQCAEENVVNTCWMQLATESATLVQLRCYVVCIQKNWWEPGYSKSHPVLDRGSGVFSIKQIRINSTKDSGSSPDDLSNKAWDSSHHLMWFRESISSWKFPEGPEDWPREGRVLHPGRFGPWRLEIPWWSRQPLIESGSSGIYHHSTAYKIATWVF